MDIGVSKELMNKVHEYNEGNFIEYYGVTDVVNPVRKYYDVKHPEIIDPPELVEKYSHGNRIQDIALKWFKSFPGFIDREVGITGKDAGINNLRGRMDFLYSDHIVEFKTTSHGIFSEKEILEKNPQDLEQLVIYALLTKKLDGKHDLVYFSNEFDNKFRSFSVNVKNNSFLNEIRHRLDSLINAIETDDPSNLGRCRYFDFGCKFRESGTCNCSNLNPIKLDDLTSSITIKRNEEMETELEKKMKDPANAETRNFSIWDLQTPRKAYLKELGLLEETEIPVDEESEKARIQTYGALSNSSYYAERRDLFLRDTFMGHVNMLSIPSEDSEGKTFNRMYPAIDRIYGYDPVQLSSENISPYHLLRLAMVCSLSASNIGYLIMGFKKDPDRIDSYRITYRNLSEIRERMEERIQQLNASIDSRDPKGLPECPTFLWDSCGKNCLCKTTPGSPQKELPEN